jgi:hypothetical protein
MICWPVIGHTPWLAKVEATVASSLHEALMEHACRGEEKEEKERKKKGGKVGRVSHNKKKEGKKPNPHPTHSHQRHAYLKVQTERVLDVGVGREGLVFAHKVGKRAVAVGVVRLGEVDAVVETQRRDVAREVADKLLQRLVAHRHFLLGLDQRAHLEMGGWWVFF